MQHHDAEITDVIIVLEELDDAKTLEVVKNLTNAGLAVTSVDHDNSTVEGSVASEKLHDLKKVSDVRYVRSVTTYSVDYPEGDPRDLDGPSERVEELDD